MDIFLLIHSIVCILVWILMKTGVLKSSSMILPFLVLIPVWGFIALIVLELHCRSDQKKHTETFAEQMLVEDEFHKSIHIDESGIRDAAAPLNEILTLNDTRTRRKIIMEVLYENPGDYIRQLQAASANEDTEVVHYAVTALVELQKDYDLKFQEMEARIKEDPDKKETRREHRELLEQYLDSGLIEKNSRIVYLEQYRDLLGREIAEETSFPLCLKKADTDLELKDYDEAYRTLRMMTEKWPDKEAGYIRLIAYYAAKKDRAGMERVMEAIRDRDVHLSPEGRRIVNFWQGGTKEESDVVV